MREHMSFGGETHIGYVREKNEDCFAIFDDGVLPYALVIADGMGGHRKGELASKIAVDQVTEDCQSYKESGAQPQQLVEQMLDSIEKANVKVYLASKEDEDNSGMGTTLTIALITENDVILAHAGDCRAYLLRDGVMVQLTEDHTLVQQMVAAGTLSPEETRGHPRRNVLTRALGVPEYVKPDHLILPREKNDRLLLCSDGLHGYVSDEKIENCMKKEKTSSELVRRLIDIALEAGGEDNVTILAAYL